MAHRLVYHSHLGLIVIKKQKKLGRDQAPRPGAEVANGLALQGVGTVHRLCPLLPRL